MNLPLDVALRATDGTLRNRDAAPSHIRVSTDTRTIEAGDTFVALHGERYDGHHFAGEALRRGASMVVVDRVTPDFDAAAMLLVDDTLRAYMALAAVARALFNGRVVGITGSAGKTTTKDFLAHLLEPAYRGRILATPANENNEIGVSRLLLSSSNAAHDVLVVEMGARHFGDIATLVELARPHVGVLTNVGEAHVEIMGSRERLAETKWALFQRGAEAVLNAQDAVSRERSVALTQRVWWFAALDSADELQSCRRLPNLTALIGERRLFHAAGAASDELQADARVPGRHNRANLAAAAATALALGLSLETVAAQLARVQLPAGRYDSIALPGGVRVIYDAYNANASATIAALDAFAAEAAPRRIAVLAGMAELGDEASALHERVGEHAARRVDLLVVEGDFADALATGARRAGLAAERIIYADDNAGVAAWLRTHAQRDDVVLLKGSRKYRMEEIVEDLQA
ncbi:MAG: UDP-N-acetylmuramoyl-tripeptide--D-alanyl-D-alanine ligase [Candidatus Eremiobacteraeota bacterium]|nr:UDP-N-acetylmuramoyl-tripeptide--D-alanyl-D-alanine ligase [Candidatus Eremiobacteraeota bacterium]